MNDQNLDKGVTSQGNDLSDGQIISVDQKLSSTNQSKPEQPFFDFIGFYALSFPIFLLIMIFISYFGYYYPSTDSMFLRLGIIFLSFSILAIIIGFFKWSQQLPISKIILVASIFLIPVMYFIFAIMHYSD